MLLIANMIALVNKSNFLKWKISSFWHLNYHVGIRKMGILRFNIRGEDTSDTMQGVMHLDFSMPGEDIWACQWQGVMHLQFSVQEEDIL